MARGILLWMAPPVVSVISDRAEASMAADYKIGIEEEYFLVDAETKSVARAMPQGFLAAAKQATGGKIMGEFLQSQIEAVTLPHAEIKTAREELRHLRQTVGK